MLFIGKILLNASYIINDNFSKRIQILLHVVHNVWFFSKDFNNKLGKMTKWWGNYKIYLKPFIRSTRKFPTKQPILSHDNANVAMFKSILNSLFLGGKIALFSWQEKKEALSLDQVERLLRAHLSLFLRKFFRRHRMEIDIKGPKTNEELCKCLDLLTNKMPIIRLRQK